jgi:serine/threonine protein kinase
MCTLQNGFYQIGILLCELLTGRPVYSGEGIHDLNMAILEQSPQIPSWGGRYEAELRAVIRRCLKKQPDERYPSVDAVIRDLEALQGK